MAFLQFDECELMIRHVAVFVASFSHDRSRHHVSRGEIRRVICAQEGQKRPGGTRRAIVSSAAFGQIAVGGKTVGVCCREIESILHRSRSSRVQAMHLARAEMKSEDRDKYINHLKKTGELQEKNTCTMCTGPSGHYGPGGPGPYGPPSQGRKDDYDRGGGGGGGGRHRDDRDRRDRDRVIGIGAGATCS